MLIRTLATLLLFPAILPLATPEHGVSVNSTALRCSTFTWTGDAQQPKAGTISYPHPMITTTLERPTFWHDEVQAKGKIGNKLFLNDIVNLDMGSHARFGVIRKGVRP